MIRKSLSRRVFDARNPKLLDIDTSFFLILRLNLNKSKVVRRVSSPRPISAKNGTDGAVGQNKAKLNTDKPLSRWVLNSTDIIYH